MQILLRYRNTLVALLIIIVFVIIVRSIYTKYTGQLNDVKEQTAVLEQGKKTLEEWQSIHSRFGKVQDKFLSKDVLDYKKFVEEKAQSAGVRIESLNFSQEDNNFYWSVLVRVRASCPYKDFVRFIKTLEEKVVQVEMLKVQNTEGPLNVEANIKGVVLK